MMMSQPNRARETRHAHLNPSPKGFGPTTRPRRIRPASRGGEVPRRIAPERRSCSKVRSFHPLRQKGNPINPPHLLFSPWILAPIPRPTDGGGDRAYCKGARKETSNQ
ncbi:hypothetical protein OPV22_020405 [Ensete ventricosum]|uniref:Uncharacterized protein n=1 Tax=Ensete ventricosum TaxID=4639 RepID=A0AAV8QK90_ENSVE|nr:hypothetical protein OPV22_020405 [Ensete ventricosum]